MIATICICGAGAMGAGIAQLFAQHGFAVTVFDINTPALQKAEAAITASFQHLADTGRITHEEREIACRRLRFVDDISQCSGDLIVEAIAEDIRLKIHLFTELARANDNKVIFATNTSSLSVYAIQQHIPHPQRLAGMHFFNPAPVMKLVEVVKGKLTNSETVAILYSLCEQVDKIPVICEDSPGFIVNRVARPYYIEAMRLVEEGIASLEEVDAIMEATGFKLGPFKLMDLIGLDVNLSVSQNIYAALHKATRLKPCAMQIEKVRNGELGKKTGKGFYRYPVKR